MLFRAQLWILRITHLATTGEDKSQVATIQLECQILHINSQAIIISSDHPGIVTLRKTGPSTFDFLKILPHKQYVPSVLQLEARAQWYQTAVSLWLNSSVLWGWLQGYHLSKATETNTRLFIIKHRHTCKTSCSYCKQPGHTKTKGVVTCPELLNRP